ncbi:MAG: hypothetical protein RL355_440, partial [Actinomycetota bacterium]
MFDRLGHFVVRHRKAILASYIAFIALAGAIGIGVFSNVKSQGYDNPNSESAKVDNMLRDEFKVRDASVVFIVDSPTLISDPVTETLIAKLADDVKAEPNVEKV